MEDIILKELNKILKLLGSVDFIGTDRHIKKINQKNVNQAYSKLFDLVKFIKIEINKDGENYNHIPRID